ncbi:MAG: hypothetical protein WBP56_11080 [Polyangia bacterium]
MTAPVERVLAALAAFGVRPSGTGWSARCPAHEDRHASLAIGEGKDGRALLFCHGGCELADVLRALGLTARDLFIGPVLRHPVIRAPSRGDPEQKVRSKACSRVSAPTSGVWSASEQTRFRTACRGMAIHVDVAMANTCGDQAARRS